MNRSRCSFVGLIALGLALTMLSAGSPHQETAPPADRHQPHDFVGRRGLVVAANPLAAEAGLEMLKSGGNAVDAAVAVCFALNAAEPFASGLGGGGWMLIYLAKERRATVIDYRERAPAAAHPRMFERDGRVQQAWRNTHGLAVAVPGAPAGWALALEKYGTRTLAEVGRRGTEIAEKGFPVSATFSAINKDEYEKLLANAGEETCFLNGGVPYEAGEILRNPDLAATFRLLAEKGAGEFYRGGLARKIVEAVRSKGGVMTLEDLSSYEAREVAPLVGRYKDSTLLTVPPPSSGGVHAVQLLNILENWPVEDWGRNSPKLIHHFAEALRFVFADRERHLGDPDFLDIPAAGLVDEEYARSLAGRIRADRVLNDYPFGVFDKHGSPGNTTHLCVVDREGNIVSLTQSINNFFATGIIPHGTGVLLNDMMDDFSEDPESVNAPGPRRRPLSSMAPLILLRKDEPFLVLGSPGGTRIFSTLVQILLNVVAFDLSLDEAIEAPRFFTYSVRGKARPLFVEPRLPEETLAALRALGHKVEPKDPYDKYFGGAQGIMILKEKGLLIGGADSRRDGAGAGY